MNTELILRYNKELSDSSPINFNGITLYPVMFADYYTYTYFSGILTLNPVYYSDIELSSLPRLYFLTDILGKPVEYANQHIDLQANLLALQGLLRLVLKDEQKFWFEKNKLGMYALVIKPYDKSEPITVNAKMFDEMREVILIQNDTDYDDTYVHPDIKRWIEEQKEREKKAQKKKTLETIEDKKEALMLVMGLSDEHFCDSWTIRRFNRMVEKLVNREIYITQMSGMMSGMVKFSETPTNWVSTSEHLTDFDKYLKQLN